MIALQEQLFEELNALVADLGKDGGLISPSIYDTAQLIRLYPPSEGVDPALDWLISQQKSDGGWGDPAVPTARDVPSLAAILAIFTYRRDRISRQIIDAGLEFLEAQADQWADAHIDALPVAAEMLLPYLLQEANSAGLLIDHSPYTRLIRLREKKLKLIHKKPLIAGSTPTFSWEALGLDADTNLLDGSGGIGHSPASTAAWLKSATGKGHLKDFVPIAERYLHDACNATQVDIPGVVPNAFPIVGFELSYGLYALHISGLLNHPALAESVARQGSEVYQVLNACNGVGFGNFFTPDVDCTSAAVAALSHLEYSPDLNCIWQFQNEEHFCTYQHELNPSVLSNAHVISALKLCGQDTMAAQHFLSELQLRDGRWLPDKWHSSWRYTTMEIVLALMDSNCHEQLRLAADAIIADQHSDGGWGMANTTSMMETSYCVIALMNLYAKGLTDENLLASLRRGYFTLLENPCRDKSYKEMYWLCKELYAPYRINRIYELSVVLSGIMSGIVPVSSSHI